MLKKKSNRRIIREKVLQVLYAHSYNRDGIEVTAGELSEEITDASEREFLKIWSEKLFNTREALTMRLKPNLKIGKLTEWQGLIGFC
ncbi:MAG: hypothetical protein IPJ75_04380 [Ignavibacteriales bacterium]|nr:hypothetical protein [Ignavibacteriales bacterium]